MEFFGLSVVTFIILGIIAGIQALAPIFFVALGIVAVIVIIALIVKAVNKL